MIGYIGSIRGVATVHSRAGAVLPISLHAKMGVRGAAPPRPFEETDYVWMVRCGFCAGIWNAIRRNEGVGE